MEAPVVAMRRREFICLLLSSAAALPLSARAQQPAIPVIGYLGSTSSSSELGSRHLRAFRQGLSEAGYVEGQNVAIENRWADDQYDRLPVLVADLVRRQVTVIALSPSTPAALAAKAATTTIPIVFQVGTDPVTLGLIVSLSRPGRNLTGVTSLNVELGSKRLELLHELVPTATSIALLVNPTNSDLAEALSRDVQAAGGRLGLQIHVLHAGSDRDLDTAFATLAQLRAGGLVIGADPFLTGRMELLAALALRHAVPAIFQYHEYAAAGGLVSYGGSVTDSSRQAEIYAGRISKAKSRRSCRSCRQRKLS